MITGEIMSTIYTLVFLLPPAGVTVWFIVSLILFLATPKEHEKRGKRKTLLLVSGIIFGVMALAICGFIALLAMAVANM